MLSNFQVGGRPLIQIFLLGQPEFADKLASPGLEQLRQRVIASHHLEAMGEDEVEAYIRHRLETVGWAGRPAFAAEAFSALHAATDGIPRRINQLANRLMLHAAVEGVENIDAAVVTGVAAEMSQDERVKPVAATRAEPVAETPAEPVLPLRAARTAPAPANEQTAAPPTPAATSVPAIEPRWETAIAALEARAAEQERMLRQVLTLLIDWVEGEAPEAYRTHAA